MDNLNSLEIFINRLKKIGIELVLFGNFPWIYLGEVNGNVVTEKFRSEHGFTLGYYSSTQEKREGYCPLLSIKETFKIIRKYR